MQLESYFEFLRPDDIRIAGTRIGIESILYDYIYGSQSPEAIAARYPSLSLEQVYAAILYYLSNRTQIEGYLADWFAHAEKRRADQEQNVPPVIARLRSLAPEQSSVKVAAT